MITFSREYTQLRGWGGGGGMRAAGRQSVAPSLSPRAAHSRPADNKSCWITRVSICPRAGFECESLCSGPARPIPGPDNPAQLPTDTGGGRQGLALTINAMSKSHKGPAALGALETIPALPFKGSFYVE